MAERTNAAVLKTAVGQPTGGSNPSPPATLAPVPFRAVAITPSSLTTLEQFEQWLFIAREKGADAFLLRKIPASILTLVVDQYSRTFRFIMHAIYLRDWPYLHFNEASFPYYSRLRGKIRGYSAHSVSEILLYQAQFDYFFLSPVFPTESHPGQSSLGLEELRRAVQLSSKPIFALGGITNNTYIKLCKDVGVYGFASIRYFLKD